MSDHNRFLHALSEVANPTPGSNPLAELKFIVNRGSYYTLEGVTYTDDPQGEWLIFFYDCDHQLKKHPRTLDWWVKSMRYDLGPEFAFEVLGHAAAEKHGLSLPDDDWRDRVDDINDLSDDCYYPGYFNQLYASIEITDPKALSDYIMDVEDPNEVIVRQVKANWKPLPTRGLFFHPSDAIAFREQFDDTEVRPVGHVIHPVVATALDALAHLDLERSQLVFKD